MAQVTVGGAAIEVALPNFKTLKAAWKYIAAVQGEADPLAGVEAILGVVSVGAVGASLTVEDLEERLRPCEMAGLRPFMNALMVEIGLAAPPEDQASGEVAPAEEGGEPFDGDFDSLIAELVAAGCGGGDWDRIETHWDLQRYGAMQRHWARHGPPAYIAIALYLGLNRAKPSSTDQLNDPEDLANFLRAFPGASSG